MSDLIRREDVLAVLCFSKETGQMVCGDLRKLLEEIKAIPSAEPERKTGKWIEDETGYGYWTCSACGFVSEAFGADILYHYCPSCGAYLKGDK